MIRKTLPLVALVLFLVLLAVSWQAEAAPCVFVSGPVQTCLPKIALASAGTGRLAAPATADDASDPANPYAFILKDGPHMAETGDVVTYRINLSNYEAVTRTVQVTESLPVHVEVVPESLADGLSYNAVTRQLRWQGEVPPAHLVYQRLPDGLALPYIDLAAYSVPNLCLTLPDCDETAVTFNLGINNRHFSYFGSLLSEITISPNGILTAGPLADARHNKWLPDARVQTAVLASLWRDVDMRLVAPPEGEGDPVTLGGRWHAALLTGLLPGHEVFYVQWHNAAAASDLDNTTRHALALALGDGPYAGHIFTIYDNIAHPEQVIADGYTIGLSDPTGSRGATVAFADCCGTRLPQGYPPAAGTTWQLAPVLLHPESAPITLSYRAVVTADVPEIVTTTAIAHTDSPNPDTQMVWATHTLFVRELTYLPLIQIGDGS